MKITIEIPGQYTHIYDDVEHVGGIDASTVGLYRKNGTLVILLGGMVSQEFTAEKMENIILRGIEGSYVDFYKWCKLAVETKERVKNWF